MDAKDITVIEEQDFDIIENAVVALRELWKKKLIINGKKFGQSKLVQEQLQCLLILK